MKYLFLQKCNTILSFNFMLKGCFLHFSKNSSYHELGKSVKIKTRLSNIIDALVELLKLQVYIY